MSHSDRNRSSLFAWLALGLAGWTLVQSSCDRRALAAAEEEVNRFRTEAIRDGAAAAGWQARFAQTRDGLTAELRDSSLKLGGLRAQVAELAATAERLGGRVAVLVEMYTGAVGQIEAQEGEVFASGTSGASIDSVTAEVDDGLLRASLAFYPPRRLGVSSYEVQLALTLGLIDTPDGRQLLTAASPDERVAVSYGQVYYEPEPPEAYCSLGTRARWGLGGAAVGGLATGLADIFFRRSGDEE